MTCFALYLRTSVRFAARHGLGIGYEPLLAVAPVLHSTMFTWHFRLTALQDLFFNRTDFPEQRAQIRSCQLVHFGALAGQIPVIAAAIGTVSADS